VHDEISPATGMCGEFLACGVLLGDQKELWGPKHMGVLLAIKRIDF
jgi:hypothetical protein